MHISKAFLCTILISNITSYWSQSPTLLQLLNLALADTAKKPYDMVHTAFVLLSMNGYYILPIWHLQNSLQIAKKQLYQLKRYVSSPRLSVSPMIWELGEKVKLLYVLQIFRRFG